MNVFWGGDEDKPVEVAIASQPAEQIIDVSQQFMQELERLGVDVKAAGVGDAVGQLSTGDLSNRELPGRIEALKTELESLPLEKLVSYSGGQGVPQPLVNALLQERMAEEKAKQALSKAVGIGSMGGAGVGALGLGALGLASGAAAAEMQPAQRSVDIALDKPIIAPEKTPQEIAAEKEKAAKGKDAGLSKIMEIVMALIGGKGLQGLFGGATQSEEQQVAQKTPDTSNPTKVGGMVVALEPAKNPVTPKLSLAVSNTLPASPSVSMSRADLGEVMPLPTPQRAAAMAQSMKPQGGLAIG